MLSNSFVAACLATTYVLALVVELNPTVSIAPERLAPIVTTMGLFYVVHLSAIFYVLLVVRQLLARELFSPAWLSIGALTWLGALSAAAGAVLAGANLYTFARVLDASTAAAVTDGALILAAAALSFVLLGTTNRRIIPEARAAWALLYLTIAAASVVMPMVLRGPGVPALLEARATDITVDAPSVERSSHVAVIAIDGGSLDFVSSATAEGRLPNFGRVLDAGAVMHLATLHPTSAEAIWAAVATGKLPQKNGVRSASAYRFAASGEALQLLPEYCFARSLVRLGLLVEEPHTSSTPRSRTLWGILSTHGLSIGVVAWPLTQPAPAVRGYLVSDAYHRIVLTPTGIVDSSAVYPSWLQADALRAMEAALADTSPVLPPSAGAVDARYETPARTDRTYDHIARELARIRPAQVTLTRYQSLDPIGHYFLRYAVPSEFGDVTEEERRRLGSVLERHYAIIDEAIGRAIAALGPDDLLLVVSGYGMEPLGFGRRLVERLVGDAELSGTHEGAPDGFLLAYGGSVARGRLTARASLVDVAPTILYFLGLPVGRDMDGYARTDLFQRSFTEERPITFIPTYDR
jgi:predicted AlkP superfamily phosphohydrolase/phosphomutase